MTLSDLRQIARRLWLRHNRGFTIAALCSLTLGIAAATAIFSMAFALLQAPLPYRDADRVVYLTERNLAQGLPQFSVSIPNFVSWREQNRAFDGLAAISGDSANLGGDDAPAERVAALRTTANLWEVLGLPLLIGRTFSAAEDAAQPGLPAAILGESLWRRRFAADPGIVGRSVQINGSAVSVVGVAPADVGFSRTVDLWLPLGAALAYADRGDRRLDVLGRLRSGLSLAQAQADLDGISARLADEFPAENRGWEGLLLPARDWIVGPAVRERLLTLSWAVAVLLLVACINVANLQIARATARAREIGVRQALGAARSRLLTQLGAESALLTLLGGALGITLAFVLLRLAVVALPPDTPRLAAIGVDWRLATLCTAVAALSSIGFALLPLWLETRRKLSEVLRAGSRGAAAASRTPLRHTLVVLQFALATVLVIAAALLTRHYQQLQQASLGFEPQRLLTARLTLPQLDENADPGPARQIYARLLAAIDALPGVEASGMASEIPLGPINTSMRIATGSGPLPASDSASQASWRVVSAGYLSTLGVPLLRGRWFADEGESSRSLLLSQGLAQQLWPDGSDPIGRSVRLSNNQNRVIVGVVGDVRQRGLGEAPTPTMYMPTSWILWPTMTVVLRSSVDPVGLVTPLRELGQRVVPEHPLFDILPMRSVVHASVTEPRLQTLVLLAFGAASLLLAALGVAGVMAFVVNRRTPDLAVRMALGASPGRLVRFMLGRGVALCLMGVLLGGLLLLPLLKLGAAGLGVQQGGDVWLPFLLAISVLGLIGLLACWLPARRVTRISPSLALVGE